MRGCRIDQRYFSVSLTQTITLTAYTCLAAINEDAPVHLCVRCTGCQPLCNDDQTHEVRSVKPDNGARLFADLFDRDTWCRITDCRTGTRPSAWRAMKNSKANVDTYRGVRNIHLENQIQSSYLKLTMTDVRTLPKLNGMFVRVYIRCNNKKCSSKWDELLIALADLRWRQARNDVLGY